MSTIQKNTSKQSATSKKNCRNKRNSSKKNSKQPEELLEKPKNSKKNLGMTQKEKAKFRSGSDWKQFRIDMIDERDNVCDFCRRKFPNPKLHIHHKNLDSAQYTNISIKEHFAVLDNACHDTLHWMHTLAISKKNKTTNQAIIDLQAPFFI